jgi:hypothetical protein
MSAIRKNIQNAKQYDMENNSSTENTSPITVKSSDKLRKARILDKVLELATAENYSEIAVENQKLGRAYTSNALIHIQFTTT